MAISEAITRSNTRKSDPRNQEMVTPAENPYNGNLATPITASETTRAFVSSLAAYRKGLSVTRRGLEVGLFHGFIVFFPFAIAGPLRDTAIANMVGLLSAIGLTTILTATLYLYAASNPPNPIATVATPNPPQELSKSQGWRDYAKGFWAGGLGGAAIAYLLFTLLGL